MDSISVSMDQENDKKERKGEKKKLFFPSWEKEIKYRLSQARDTILHSYFGKWLLLLCNEEKFAVSFRVI